MTQKQTINGKVVSDKMKGAVVVEVVRLVPHPIYGKRLRRTKRLHAQNEVKAKIGDFVSLCQIKPLSKTVAWKVVEVKK